MLSSAAVIHGSGSRLDIDDSNPVDTVNYVTVVPNPCLHRCCLQVSNACCSTPAVKDTNSVFPATGFMVAQCATEIALRKSEEGDVAGMHVPSDTQMCCVVCRAATLSTLVSGLLFLGLFLL